MPMFSVLWFFSPYQRRKSSWEVYLCHRQIRSNCSCTKFFFVFLTLPNWKNFESWLLTYSPFPTMFARGWPVRVLISKDYVVMSWRFNSLWHCKILDWSKLRAYADDKINVTEKLKFVLGRVENIVGKGENAVYCFPHSVFKRLSFKSVNLSWNVLPFTKQQKFYDGPNWNHLQTTI